MTRPLGHQSRSGSLQGGRRHRPKPILKKSSEDLMSHHSKSTESIDSASTTAPLGSVPPSAGGPTASGQSVKQPVPILKSSTSHKTLPTGLTGSATVAASGGVAPGGDVEQGDPSAAGILKKGDRSEGGQATGKPDHVRIRSPSPGLATNPFFLCVGFFGQVK